MEWIKAETGVVPSENEVVFVFSPIDGVGLAKLEREYGVHRRWVWTHKTINGSNLVNGVAYWCRVELPITLPPGEIVMGIKRIVPITKPPSP